MLLVVDDDSSFLRMLERMLGRAGFDVVTASDGAEAIAKLDLGHDRLTLVITDIRLGNGPDGWAVGRHARELDLDMPLIYISGDRAPEWQSEGVPGSAMIPKPFRAAQLVEKILELLADYHPPGHHDVMVGAGRP